MMSLSRVRLYDPVDCRPPGSSVHGILQARILEWVAISFSRGSSWLRDWTQVSHIAGRRFNLWATREVRSLGLTYMCAYAHSCLTLSDSTDCSSPGSLSTEFSRQEYWSGLPFPTPGDLPDPGIEPSSLPSPAMAGRFFKTVLPMILTTQYKVDNQQRFTV